MGPDGNCDRKDLTPCPNCNADGRAHSHGRPRAEIRLAQPCRVCFDTRWLQPHDSCQGAPTGVIR